MVIDAAYTEPSSPGRVHRLVLESARPARTGTTSSHGLGLGEAIELSSVLGRLPGRLVVYAVEGADRTLGTGLTEPVAARVEELAHAVREELTRYGSGTKPDKREDRP